MKLSQQEAEPEPHSEPLPVLLPEGSHLSGCCHDNQKSLATSPNIPASLHSPVSTTLKGITKTVRSHKIRNHEASSPLDHSVTMGISFSFSVPQFPHLVSEGVGLSP